MFFDFQTKIPVSIFLYACLYSNSMICVVKPKESLKTKFICQLSQIHYDILQLCKLKPFFVSRVTLRRKRTA